MVDLNKPLPWELPFVPQHNSMWKHIVFLGKHSKEEVIDVINLALGNNNVEKPDWLEKPTGNTCMAVLILNEQGQLLGDSPYLQAAYLHGLRCLQQVDKLSEINKLLDEVQEKFRERYPYIQEAKNLESSLHPVITSAHLKKEIAVLNDLDIKGIACNTCVYVYSLKVSKQSKGDTGFLNSFYLDDLNHLINSSGAFGKGLDSYLVFNAAPFILSRARKQILFF